MSIQLTIDEMLDLLQHVKHPQFERHKHNIEAMASMIAHDLEDAISELVKNGDPSFKGSAFCGTCAFFRPRSVGPVPAPLEFFSLENDEWLYMCEEMKSQ